MRDDGRVQSEEAATTVPAKGTTALLAVAGILTGVAGLVTAQATVWLLQAPNGPVYAVASAVRDFTPGPIANFLVHDLIKNNTVETTALRVGTIAILLGICAWIGAQTTKRPLLPPVAYVVLALLGLGAVHRLPDSTSGSTLGLLVGLVTLIVVHRVLTGAVLQESSGPVGRRSFLVRAGVVAVLAAGAGIAGDLSRRRVEKVEKERRLLRLPIRRGTPPEGTSLGVEGIAPWRTPSGEFYTIATTLSPPVIAQEEWSLRIHGMVDRELTLTYEDLAKRSFTEDWVTLACVSNEVGGDLIGNAFWSGVLVRELLAEAGVDPDADAVLQTSHDGWTCGTPLVALTDDRNSLLALGMNGKPLPIEHGYPVRMVVPGLYGFVSATKWLVDLEVSRFDKFDAYWTERGWAEQCDIRTQSRIDVPARDGEVAAGTLKIGGVAWAQHLGIERVEYQLDGGAWKPAELGRATESLDTWVQWAASVEVAAGEHTVLVRATDKNGYTQTSELRDVIPDGATGWDEVTFTAS